MRRNVPRKPIRRPQKNLFCDCRTEPTPPIRLEPKQHNALRKYKRVLDKILARASRGQAPTAGMIREIKQLQADIAHE